MKKEIQKERLENPEKFIKIDEIFKKGIKYEDEDEDEYEGLFALGLLVKNLEDSGIETTIESTIKEEEEDELDSGTTILQFISNGFSSKQKYNLQFDFEEKRKYEILENSDEYEKFKKN